jgi:Zn-finger nucleic acid-binding protein
MKCPVCKDPDLVMSDRQGVEIDYCPSCRGVWLDRGELDKIIERSEREQRAAPAAQAPAQQRSSHGSDRYPQHRRKSMWRELFD